MDPNPRLALRLAVSADVPALVRLINLAYRGSDRSWTSEGKLVRGPRIADHEVAQRILAPSNVILVAERAANRGRELVGCVHVEPRGAAGYIGLLSVEPEAQSARAGSFLMDAAERHAREKLGCSEAMVWVVSARNELRAWYERRGYIATGETHPFPQEEALVPGLSFVVLRKALARG